MDSYSEEVSIRIIDRFINDDLTERISSLPLLEFIYEWNRGLKFVSEISEELECPECRLLLVLTKIDENTYTLNIEYHEGGLITVDNSIVLYEGSKQLNVVLEIFETLSQFQSLNPPT